MQISHFVLCSEQNGQLKTFVYNNGYLSDAKLPKNTPGASFISLEASWRELSMAAKGV